MKTERIVDDDVEAMQVPYKLGEVLCVLAIPFDASERKWLTG